MIRIGIFGGTFAPFHLGHLTALHAFCTLARLNRCIVIPSGTPPHKTKTNLFTDEERLQMTQRICDGIPGVTVSDWEIRKGGRSYTSQTLAHLNEQFPDARLVLYVGSDMFLTLQDWHQPQEIFHRAEIAAFSRTGDDLETLNTHKNTLSNLFDGVDCTVYSAPTFPVSSTEIREKWSLGESISHLVPEAVDEYLGQLRTTPAATDLSWERYRTVLRERLSDHRLKHSEGVMKEAELLARIHGADPEKAKIAGFLHDMTKEFSREEHFRLFEKYDVFLDDNLKTNKNLWHAVSASCDVTETLGITDGEIVSAIRYHTTGKAAMTPLETILYVADLTEPNRDYDDVDFYRALAREDVDKAAYLAMRWCMADLERRGLPVHQDMIDGVAHLAKKFPGITEEQEKLRMKTERN